MNKKLKISSKCSQLSQLPLHILDGISLHNEVLKINLESHLEDSNENQTVGRNLFTDTLSSANYDENNLRTAMSKRTLFDLDIEEVTDRLEELQATYEEVEKNKANPDMFKIVSL